MAKRVFQIAFDKDLMVTRELVLKSRGYEVVSVFGEEAAGKSLAEASDYDLFIVGHNAADVTRRKVAGWLKSSYPEAKVLSLNPPHTGGVSVADYNVSLNGPEEWLRVVVSAIG